MKVKFLDQRDNGSLSWGTNSQLPVRGPTHCTTLPFKRNTSTLVLMRDERERALCAIETKKQMEQL